MDIDSVKTVASALEERSEGLLRKLTAVLREEGFEGLEVVAFSAAAVEFEVASFGPSPCPTVCSVMPDGSIRCEPKC